MGGDDRNTSGTDKYHSNPWCKANRKQRSAQARARAGVCEERYQVPNCGENSTETEKVPVYVPRQKAIPVEAGRALSRLKGVIAFDVSDGRSECVTLLPELHMEK